MLLFYSFYTPNLYNESISSDVKTQQFYNHIKAYMHSYKQLPSFLISLINLFSISLVCVCCQLHYRQKPF